MYDKIMNEIIDNRKRIKNIRKSILRCTQNDLACKGLSREMISMLENKTKNLTKETAEIIANNINKYATDRNMVINITKEKLMKSEIEQAHDMVQQSLEHINILIKSDNTTEQFLDIYNKVNDVFIKYHIERSLTFEFYNVSIDYSLDNRMLPLAKECIFRCFEAAESEIEKLNVFTKLTKIEHYYYEYDYIIYIANFAIDFYNKHNFNDLDTLQRLYYNLALAYKDKENYEKCFEIFEIVNELNINYLNFDILHANCLYDTKKYQDAETYYLSILSKAKFINDSKVIFRIQQNLALLYLKTNKISNANEYIQLALRMKCHKTSSEESYLYYYAFIIDLGCGNGKLKINRSFHEAIKKSVTACNSLLQVKLFDKITEYYINNKHSDDLINIINNLEQSVLENKISNEKYFHIFNKSAKYFLDNNEQSKACYVFQKTMNISSNYTESDFF